MTKKSKEEKEKLKKVRKVAGYMTGSAALCAVAAAVIPKALPVLSSKLNKEMTTINNRIHEDEDWGPVIEKIEK